MTTRLPLLVGALVVGVLALSWAVRSATRPPVARSEARSDVAIETPREPRRAGFAPGSVPAPAPKEKPLAADAERAAPATPADAGTETEEPLTDEDFRMGLATFGENLRHVILNDTQGEVAAAELRELLRRAGPERLRQLMERFADETEEMGARIVIAHALAQSNDPGAIAALAGYLRDPQSGLLVQRYASHALAFSDAEGVERILLDVATHCEERGTRANSAFGLARRGSDEGLRLYFGAMDEAFAAGDPGALQYLGGLRLLGARALPGVRERLQTYKNEQALLVLIGGVKAARDQESLPILERLAYDTTQSISVQKAAKGAIQAMSETKG